MRKGRSPAVQNAVAERPDSAQSRSLPRATRAQKLEDRIHRCAHVRLARPPWRQESANSKRACCASVNRFKNQFAPACAPDDVRASTCPISASASTRPLQITTCRQTPTTFESGSKQESSCATGEICGRVFKASWPGLSRPSTWFGASSARKQPAEAEKPRVCRALQRTATIPDSSSPQGGADSRDKPRP